MIIKKYIMLQIDLFTLYQKYNRRSIIMNKRIMLIFLCIFVIVTLFTVFISCEDDDGGDDDGYSEEPEALPEHDSNSGGVYKGVIVGSSGAFKIIIDNGTGEYLVLIQFDGIETTLSSSYFDTWTPGTAITDAIFTGTLGSDTVTLTFSVNADGSNPEVELTIPGHTTVAVPVKETSEALVICILGEAISEGEICATWNFTIQGDSGTGVGVEIGEDVESDGFDMTLDYNEETREISNGLVTFFEDIDPEITFSCILSEDLSSMTGEWYFLDDPKDGGALTGTRVELEIE
jgi:hypothetical protein